MHRVFVYGTLKRGEPNHHWFTKDVDGIVNFVSKAKTVEKYPLIIHTKYNIPFLLYKPGLGHNVHGEVYEVNDKVLKNLDILESHPEFYERQQREVTMLSDKNVIETTWIYFVKQYRPHLLELPFYDNYTNGLNGCKYTESEECTVDEFNEPFVGEIST